MLGRPHRTGPVSSLNSCHSLEGQLTTINDTAKISVLKKITSKSK